MKKTVVSLLAGAVLCAMSSGTAFAEADLLYGTMEIPYAAFYAEEGPATEVDAVTSATNGKWKNENLVAGTYYAAHESDEGGDILGVVYPVAISADDLSALGDDNYAFTALEEAPAAYKLVTVADGAASFSAIQGESSTFEAAATLTTESRYGDYQIDVKSINNQEGSSDLGTIAGVLLTTSDGSVYGLRHLENIWRDALAWSCGVKTVEGHGNALSYDQYADMMGKTITAITYLTETGYHTLATSLYLPVKFVCTAEIASVPASDGQAAISLEGFPEDYDLSYAVDGLTFTVDGDTLSFTDALAGSYNAVISDASGVYADVLTSFVLSTEEQPAAYDAEALSLVAAPDADEATFAAFLKNITSVSVNEETYNASGRGAVAIIDSDGALDPEAAITTGRGADAVTTPIFAESGDYAITVNASGYPALSFTYTVQ